MVMVMADFPQTRVFGKVDGQFLHARWRMQIPIIDVQIGGWAVSFTRSVLESDCRFRSLSYTSYAGVCPVVFRVRCVCYTPDAKDCLFVRRVGTFSYTPCSSSGEDYLLYAPWWNVSGRSSGEDYLLYAP